MIENKIATKKMDGFLYYLENFKNSCNKNENEMEEIFINATKVNIFHRENCPENIKFFYKGINEKLSLMLFENLHGKKNENNVPLKEIKIILMDIKKMMKENSIKLKKIDFQKDAFKTDKNIEYVTDVYSILDKAINYTLFQVSNNKFYLGELISLLVIKNQLESILYNNEFPSSDFVSLFKSSKEFLKLDRTYDDRNRNIFIENMKSYFYGWSMENLNKEFLKNSSNIKNLKVIEFDEWKLREKQLGYKYYHPSMDMEGELNGKKLLFENKNYYLKNEDKVKIRINKSLIHHISRLNSTMEYDKENNTNSHYLITLIKNENIKTYIIPYSEYLSLFEKINEEKNKVIDEEKNIIYKNNIPFFKCILNIDGKEIKYEERINKDVRNNKNDFFIYEMNEKEFEQYFEQYKIENYLEKPIINNNKGLRKKSKKTILNDEDLNNIINTF